MKKLIISHKNIGLQFFLWTWEANKDKLNICKLFWGTIFLPLGFFTKSSNRPFYYLSPLTAIYLTCIAVPGLCFGKYALAMVGFLSVLCLMFYSYIRREAIAIKCDREDLENKAQKAEMTAKDCRFSERTERILEKILTPFLELISFVIEPAEKFYRTRPGERITGLLSLFYHFLCSIKQRTCFLIKVE